MGGLITPEAQAIVGQAETTLQVISTVRVTTPEECQGLVDQIKEIKALGKRMDEVRTSITKPLDEEKKAVMDFFRAPTELLTKCEALGKAEISRWTQE